MYRVLLSTGALAILMACASAPVSAQSPSVPPLPLPLSANGAATGTTLAHVLEKLTRSAGVTVLTDSTLAFERATSNVDFAPGGSAEEQEQRIEAQLTALVKSLPAGSVWAKLYLPAPPSGRVWRGDDVSAYAYAQARLFGPVGALPPPGEVEIMGRRVDQAAARPLVATLGLKPIYLVTNARKRTAPVGAEPWSPLSREQWSQLSKEDAKAYGQQQAAQIMALPPEERKAIIDQMKQHDKYFDSVKDPLEKAIGHDL